MKRKMTEEERKRLDEILKKEREKYERDSKGGGTDGNCHYRALHYR